MAGVALLASILTYVEATWPTTTALLGGYLRVDATSRLFLGFMNPIFFAIAVYVWSRLSTTPSLQERMGRFVFCSLLFFSASNVVLTANHFFVLWIALEVSTLAAAPLTVRDQTHASRLASFRYLLFSSVGLSLVLLGFVCLSRSIEASGQAPTFFLDRLQLIAGSTTDNWGKLGVALIILGLGTKIGLAPMYSWLPEVYDQAPPAVTALLGAVQFNAALVFLLRVVQVFRPAHPGLIASVLLAMGLVSMVVSTFSIIATRNMVRLIAYASINHAGVIAIGLGIGKNASYGLLLYVISNAFIKAILFLTAGKIEARYGTKDTRRIDGLLKELPYSGVFLMVGTFALLGFPPFGSFFGELLILSALVGSGHLFVFAAFCLLITMTFVATGRTVFPMIWGESKQRPFGQRQTLISATPKLFFLLVLLVLGIYIPPVVNRLIQQVATSLEGS
jgi:hydrogenase-4 component F